MDTYEIEICGIKRQLPYIAINDKLAFASFVILGDVELISACAGELAKKIGPVDMIVTAEAKGIALAYEVSKCLGLKEFIVARKSVKAYMKNPLCEDVQSITTTEKQKLYLDGLDVDKIRGKRVCILDDVISTGESLNALSSLAQKAGALIACQSAILAEGDAAKRDDIIFLKKLPLFETTEDGKEKAL